MYAIMETGGKQYRVSPGQVLKVEKLEASPGETVEIDRVLLVSSDVGVNVGSRWLEGAKVVLKVRKHGKEIRLSSSNTSRRRTTGGNRAIVNPILKWS